MLVLAGTELTLRFVQTRLSRDLIHIQQIPEAVARVSQSEKLRVLFLGNSLSREGIDLQLFQSLMSHKQDIAAAQLFPDDTSILDWLRVYQHFVVNQRHEIDLLILCYAENQLQDDSPINIRRLAQNFTDWNAALGLFQSEEFSFDMCAEFTLAKFFASYANAERVRVRILDWVVPYYHSSAEQMNAVPSNSKQVRKHQPTYNRLKLLIDVVQSSGTKMVVVVFPVGDEFVLDPELIKLLQQEDVLLVDARHVKGITKRSFPDGYHMNDEAAQVMSRYLASVLKDYEFSHRPVKTLREIE